MDELEIAQKTLQFLRQHPHGTEFRNQLLSYWLARRDDLEAAEQQAQPSKTVVDELLELSDRFACLYGRVDNLEGFNAEVTAKIKQLERITGSANVKIKRLEDRCDWHERKDGA